MQVQARSQFSVILMFQFRAQTHRSPQSSYEHIFSTHEDFVSQINTPDSENAICYTALIAKWMQSFRIQTKHSCRVTGNDTPCRMAGMV